MDGTILIADDDRTIRTVLTQALTRAGCKVHATSSLVTLLRWVKEGKGDLIITDVMMPDGNGLEALPKIAKQRPDLPVIVISAQNNIMTAIHAAEAEAFDYLPKPFDLPDLMKRSARALKSKSRSPKIDVGNISSDAELPLVGKTAAMQAVYRLVARVMNTDLPVLITGESGTGKSLVARALHDFSDRRNMPFLVLGATEFEKMESLGQIQNRVGSGTLLFDEIGDYTYEAQAKVVRLLDGLGENPPRSMATSQADLHAMMDAGKFRKDLFYRLGGVTIEVPPLRERMDDIDELAGYFLSKAHRESSVHLQLGADALALMRKFTWPGNVRQLENIIKRLALTSTEPEITAADAQAVLHRQPAIEPMSGLGEEDRLSGSVEKHLRRYFDLHGSVLPPAGLYPRILKEIELPLLSIAMEATGGNQAKCADLLGINRNTLRKKLTELDIRVTRRRKLM